MMLSEEGLQLMRREAEADIGPATRCAGCRHFAPIILPPGGVHLPPDGVCQLHGALIENAHRRRCDGWQSDVYQRREDAGSEVGRQAACSEAVLAAVSRLDLELTTRASPRGKVLRRIADELRAAVTGDEPKTGDVKYRDSLRELRQVRRDNEPWRGRQA
jgi:hypothetical protein